MFNSINHQENSTVRKKDQADNPICCNNRSGTLRSIWYFLGIVLLICVTTLIFFSLFTNHWIVTTSKSINDNDVYYLQGVFFRCRAVRISWITEEVDKYCKGVVQGARHS